MGPWQYEHWTAIKRSTTVMMQLIDLLPGISTPHSFERMVNHYELWLGHGFQSHVSMVFFKAKFTGLPNTPQHLIGKRGKPWFPVYLLLIQSISHHIQYKITYPHDIPIIFPHFPYKTTTQAGLWTQAQWWTWSWPASWFQPPVGCWRWSHARRRSQRRTKSAPGTWWCSGGATIGAMPWKSQQAECEWKGTNWLLWRHHFCGGGKIPQHLYFCFK